MIVAIGIHPQRAPLFTVEERVALMKEICASYENVEVQSFSGLLVDSGDIGGMVDALAALSGQEQRHRLGQAARARYEEKFTVDQMTRRYENVYRELAGR